MSRYALCLLASVGCGGSAQHAHDAGADGIPVDAAVDAASNQPDASTDAPTIQLAAISPPLARQSGTVVLEGSFSGSLVAQLPGGTSAAVNVLGPHRATITIPVGTMRGETSVTAGGASPRNVMFHGTSYAPGFRRPESYEQGDAARQPGVLDVPRMGHGSVTLDNHVYLIGGYGYVAGVGTTFSEISAATINADGSLSAFDAVPGVSLVHHRTGFATVVAGDYVYAIGGYGPDDSTTFTTTPSIERAAITPDRTLDTFEDLPTTLVVPRYAAMATVIGNYIYVVGGYTPNTPMPVDAVERAVINPDGTLGDFELLTSVALAQARSDAAIAVIGDQVYVVAGAFGGNPLDSVEAATIAPDGSISTFSIVPGVTLSVPRYGLSVAVLDDALYAIGGGGDYSNPSTEIERAPIQLDGSLGAFATTGTNLGSSWRMGSTLAFTTNYAYVIAGDNGEGPALFPTLRLAIDAGDTLDTSDTAAGTTLDAAIYDHATVAVGGYVYALGGTDGTNLSSAVQRATVTDGVLGSFTTLAGVALATPRAGFATAVIGDYVYVIGGTTGGGVVGSLERAPIMPDGTLGTFTAYTDTVLATPRSHAAAVIVRAYAATELYVVGGIGADGTILGTIEEAGINADGSLGAFTVKTGYGLTTPRYDLTLAEIDFGAANSSWVFAVGGIGASGYLGDVERGYIQADGTLGPFLTQAGATLTPRAEHASTVIGDRIYVIGGNSAAGPLDSIESSTIQTDSNGVVTLTAFSSTNGVTLANPRRGLTCMAIANQVYSIGGADSGGALASIELAPLQ